MSFEVFPALASAQTGATHVVKRRSAGYHPSVWGDHFLTYASGSLTINERADEQRIEKLKMEVKRMLTDHADDFDKPYDNKLDLIDQIQRLGIGYQFAGEIDEVLEHIHIRHSKCDNGDNAYDDLRTAALRFRLLRQQAIFNKFKDSEGKFRESLVEDVRGLLSLYEASHLRVHGEDILEEALSFTVRHLKEAVQENDDLKLNPNLLAEVKHALEQCLRKELKLHRRELGEITRWWKDCLDVEKNLPFARDRITECYFWILGVYFEPDFSLARMMLTKATALTSILDDIYDVYGTPKELQLLTSAIDRWDVGAIDELPQYLQIFYKALLDTYGEFEKVLAEQGRTYRFFYAKEAVSL
ncbi:hypothetical protein CRG98_011845 [Punica granatum]|uniref:(-)-germacrene D synthase-like n=1 Tax=Punica granatum TaxID=22663 RepID=A0A2I0KGJ6_PUNGR|nr:hypothetical protein CRG98_011845 [Punica granatum]